MLKKILPLLILLCAFALRAYGFLSIPPGLTHDEAGHGHDAAYILKGVTPIYFTVGYGREPLFDYLNAGLIAFMGASILTLRFAALAWGTLTLALTYRVARTAFDQRTAVIALAFISVSFWQLATSRQILRSGLLPVEISVSVILFLKLTAESAKNAETKYKWLLVIGLALAIAASFYTYIPSRILWLIFPLALITNYLLRITHYKPHAIRHTLYALLLAFLFAAPLFLYLYQNPEAEQRVGMLNEPLAKLQNGDPSILLNNAREFFLAFFLNGHGDHFPAYTIPGRALFDPITAVLFMLGLLFLLKWSVISNRLSTSLSTAHYSLFTFWLLLGLAPSLITGPEALTTRIIGAQPLLYILPALAVSRWLLVAGRWFRHFNFILRLSPIIITLFIVSVGAINFRDYLIWGNSPDVRAAYQSTTIAMAQSLDAPSVISTIHPTAAHDPYIAELITTQETRWIDGRTAFLIPNRSAFKLLVPSSTPLHSAFAKYAQPLRTVNLRPNDLDPSFAVYSLTVYPSSTPLANFNNALELLEAKWLAPAYQPNGVAELLTVWRVTEAKNLGAVYPPAFKTDLNLFTHILKDGDVYLQRDALDAPSWDWQTGDIILQIHQIALPGDAAKGEYKVRLGIYDRATGERMVIKDSGEDTLAAPPLVIR